MSTKQEYYTPVGSYDGVVKLKGRWVAVSGLNYIDKKDWLRKSGPATPAIVKALKRKPVKATALFPKAVQLELAFKEEKFANPTTVGTVVGVVKPGDLLLAHCKTCGEVKWKCHCTPTSRAKARKQTRFLPNPEAAESLTPKRSMLGDKIRQATQSTDVAPHVIVVARAGTGKTTTLVYGIAYMFRNREVVC